MSKLSDELSKMLKVDKALECDTRVTFRCLPEEDQQALRDYFMVWAKAGVEVHPGTTEDDAAGLIAVGFTLGHNWVKDHWTLW